MNEAETLARMVAPGTRRPGKYREGVVQIHVTRACDKACFGCTQGSNLTGRQEFIGVDHFARAVDSLKGYFGVVGMFGGNPAVHPKFKYLCAVLENSWVPKEQRGIWCNNPMTLENARIMQGVFDPAVSNLNVHLDAEAYSLFKEGWPECHPVGLHEDSRHSPPFVAMKDMKELSEARRWELISDCDINQHWSAMVGVFRGELRAWFCEVAGAQSMLHQDDPSYPDTGIDPTKLYGNPTKGHLTFEQMQLYLLHWWELPMARFQEQVRKHCHECGVPLRGYGEKAQAKYGIEQTSATHEGVYKPKRPNRLVQVATSLQQLGVGKLKSTVRYLQNAQL